MKNKRKKNVKKTVKPKVASVSIFEHAIDSQIFDSFPDPVAVLGPDHRIMRYNAALKNVLKTESGLLIHQFCYNCIHETCKPPANCPHLLTMKDGKEHTAEVYESKLRGYFLVTTKPLKDKNGKTIGSLHVMRDITERKKNEETLYRINRQLQALSSCSQILIRATDEQTLLNDICQVVCEKAGYRLAWVGFVEHDDAKAIRPVAWAGFDSGYIKNAKLSWSNDTERGQGPAGMAVRTGKSIYVEDFSTDPRMVPWRESALQRGYHSGIALPLKDKDANVFGVLLIYSTEPNVITKEEIRLMQELSDDLAYGLISLRFRDKLKQAEEERKAHVHFLESIEKIYKAIEQETDMDCMLRKAVNTVFSIFQCDRAWLFYPCDPNAPTFTVPIEISRPEYPGAGSSKQEIPMGPSIANDLRKALESADPLTYTNKTERPVNTQTAREFAVQAQMFSAIYPKIGKPWVFGMHQCSYPRIWTENERILFKEISRLIADGLSNVLLLRDLSEKERKFRIVADNTYDWEFWIDPQGRYVYSSPSCLRVTGHPPEEFVNNPDLLNQIIHPDDQERHFEHVQKAQGSKEPSEIEFRIILPDGTRHWLGHICQAVFDEKGNFIGRRGSNRDITERKRMEQELLELNRTLEEKVARTVSELRYKDQMMILQSRQAAMGEMLGNIAHQWRQPLNVIGILVQNLMEHEKAGNLEKEYLKTNVIKTMDLILHMSRTIDDFRNFFKPDKEKTPFSLQAAVKNSLSFVSASYMDHNVQSILECNEDITVLGFPNEFSQVLLNIFNNALDAIIDRKPKDPLVTIWIRREKERAVVTITDNAGGIQPQILHKIFEPYFTTKEMGTGIGLFMAKTIIEKNMSGKLMVRNTSNGAEFRIEI